MTALAALVADELGRAARTRSSCRAGARRRRQLEPRCSSTRVHARRRSRDAEPPRSCIEAAAVARTRSTSSRTTRSTPRSTGAPRSSSRGIGRRRASEIATRAATSASPTSGCGETVAGRSSAATRRRALAGARLAATGRRASRLRSHMRLADARSAHERLSSSSRAGVASSPADIVQPECASRLALAAPDVAVMRTELRSPRCLGTRRRASRGSRARQKRLDR